MSGTGTAPSWLQAANHFRRTHMSTSTAPQTNADYGVEQPRRLTTETKNATKTTEFFIFVAMVLAVVVTANVYDGNGTDGDPFGATTAMRYVVYLTIAYLVSRGLAKSGSREAYDA
jgi:hypothetical protein